MLNKTNLYAVARDIESDAPQSGTHQYHKAHPKWTIMAESHPMLGKAEVVEYCATWDDESGHHHIHPLELGSHDSITGSILIAESSHVSQKELSSILKEQYKVAGSSLGAESSSEEWLKHAIRTLQDQKVLEKFDIAEFMTFAHGYIANRQAEAHDAPATIAYPQLHPDHEKKAKKHGFWVSHPETAENRSGEKVYGGLM